MAFLIGLITGVAIDTPPVEVNKKRHTASRDLGKCERCKKRDAVWDGYHGKVCNSCDDKIIGLE